MGKWPRSAGFNGGAIKRRRATLEAERAMGGMPSATPQCGSQPARGGPAAGQPSAGGETPHGLQGRSPGRAGCGVTQALCLHALVKAISFLYGGLFSV